MSEKQKALLLMLLSVFSLSVMQFIVKLSGDRITIMEQVFTRNFFCLIISMITLFASKGSFWGKAANRPALLTRSVLGFIGIAGYFYATKYMNIADASMLQRSSPFFTIVFSALFLKNRITKLQVMALVLGFLGAFLVITPKFDSGLVPALIGLLSAVGAGGAYVCINFLKGKESNATIIFQFSLVSSLLSLLLGGSGFVLPRGSEWLMLLGLGVFAGGGQMALTQAYKMANPGDVGIIQYLGIIFSALLGYFFLQEKLIVLTGLGMVLILSAALVLYIRRDAPVKQPDERKQTR
jgi:drug/metabolite transporter (DMT)-like permease